MIWITIENHLTYGLIYKLWIKFPNHHWKRTNNYSVIKLCLVTVSNDSTNHQQIVDIVFRQVLKLYWSFHELCISEQNIDENTHTHKHYCFVITLTINWDTHSKFIKYLSFSIKYEIKWQQQNLRSFSNNTHSNNYY